MTRLLLSILYVSMILPLSVNEDVARRVASNLFLERGVDLDFEISSVDIVSEDSYDLFYIFNLAPKGFVLVSADDRVLPILGYGFEDDFIYSEEMPTNIKYLLDLFKEEIKTSIINNTPASNRINDEWSKYMSGSIDIENLRTMAPLLSSRFDQGATWNTLCPTDQAGPDGHALVGCVAVSMGQVMHYWEYPQYGNDDHGYNSPYGYLYADFGNTFYDYDEMETNIGTPASQLLLLHAGIAVNMNYGADGSGAWVMGPQSPSTYHAMTNYFNFKSTITGIYPENFSESVYRQKLIDDLDLHRPIIYRGCSNDGCHAWNIDGYEGDTFHCNWGWGGYNNGYFPLSTLGGFPYSQGALTKIEPQDLTLPNLVINSVQMDDQVGGDGDGIINPGEEVSIILELENFIPWADGYNLEVQLDSNVPGITVLDDTFYINAIDAGDAFINSSNPFSIFISDEIELGSYSLDLYIVGGNDYFEDYTIDFQVSMNQSSFPYLNNQTIESSPLAIDIDGDGYKELFFGDYGGVIHGIDSEGSSLPGFPIQLEGDGVQIWGSPAVDDLDNDGILELVFSSKNKHVYIVDVYGTIELDYETEQFMMGTPALGDVDGDGLREIVVAGYDTDGKIFVLNPDGSNVDGFPLDLNQTVLRGVALKDLNGNNKDDIVVCTQTDNQLLLINDNAQVDVLYTASEKFKSAPAIAEIDGENYIFAGNDNDILYGFTPEGELVYEFLTNDRIRTTPAFYKYGNSVSIFYGSYDGFIYGKDKYGDDLEGFPIDVNSSVITSPVISDLNNDGEVEIIFGTTDGSIIAINSNNQSLDYFPVDTGVGITGSPMVTDLDSDGDIEVLIGANTTLFGLDIKESSSVNEGWSMYRGNSLRNGSFAPVYMYDSGDLNGDSSLNILDIVLLSSLILSQDFSDSDFVVADLNTDNVVDILDLVVLINLILE